jgi:hypothetical protein
MQLRRAIIPLVLLTGWFSLAHADELQLAENAPSSYIVVKVDTLWGISGRFLKKPWRWPEIWNMNKAQVKDPHWIYPGEVISLDYVNGKPRLSIGKQAGRGSKEKLSPHIRESTLDKEAIPSIPPSVIGPFLSRHLVIEENGMATAPVIVAAENERVITGTGSKTYVEGIGDNQATLWQIYRPGSALKDPDNGEILGYEATYLGEARVTRSGNPTTMTIVKSKEEINKGDRLVPATNAAYPSYSPHAPDKVIKGRVMSAPGGVDEIGQNAIVTISKGTRDGLEIGHVLAAYRLGATVKAPEDNESKDWFGRARTIKLPDEYNGLIFIFRTFEKVSYGLVVQSVSSLHVGDVVQTPEN